MCVAIVEELKQTNSKLIEKLLSRHTSVLLHSCMFSYITNKPFYLYSIWDELTSFGMTWIMTVLIWNELTCHHFLYILHIVSTGLEELNSSSKFNKNLAFIQKACISCTRDVGLCIEITSKSIYSTFVTS